jgi:hypothetical protein
MKILWAASAALLLAAGSTTGSFAEGQRMDSVSGNTYSASEAQGGVGLDHIRTLPTDVAPFPVVLEVDKGKYLKERPKIAVPSYAVSYITSAEARASSAGAGSASINRSIRYNTALVGIDEAAMKQWADEAHADLVDRLAKAGFEVVTAEAMRAVPDYGKVKWIEGNRTQDGQIIDGRAKKGWVVFGAMDAPLITGMSMETGMAAIMSGQSAGALQNVGVDLDAMMVHPLLVLDYIAIQSSGNKMFSAKANVSAETNFSIHPRSKVDFAYKVKRMPGTGYTGWMSIADGFPSGEEFGVLREVDDQSDSMVMHNAMALLGLGNSYKQKKILVVEPVPARYAALVKAAYQGYNQAIVDGIVKARAGG